MLIEEIKKRSKELKLNLNNIEEKIVRNSYEYREYVKFLKEEIDMNECSFFKGLTRDDVRIEIHHAPFTLYDITAIMVNEARINAVNPTAFSIAESVMKLHFEGLVGLIVGVGLGIITTGGFSISMSPPLGFSKTVIFKEALLLVIILVPFITAFKSFIDISVIPSFILLNIINNKGLVS